MSKDKQQETPIQITSLSNITIGKSYSFSGIILKVIFAGDKEKNRPLKFLVEFEESNQKVVLTDWGCHIKDIIDDLIGKRTVVNFEIKVKEANYKDEKIRYDLDEFESTGVASSKPLPDESDAIDNQEQNTNDNNAIDISKMKQEISTIINGVKNENYKNILNWLILSNDNFFIWPAAYSVHHAFPTGLYVHTMGVYENALSLARRYMPKVNVNIDLITTGALLHDIGKLVEYNQDGTFTTIGNMLSHLVIGAEMIDDACRQLNINSYDMDIIKLKHIIVSHHGEKQFGSPNEPVITEAYIINAADREDAKLETIAETLERANDFDYITMKGSGKIMKI